MEFKLNRILKKVNMTKDIVLIRDIFPERKINSRITRDKYGVFSQINFEKIQIEHGFKIHISIEYNYYQEILNKVFDYCKEKKITFKYISNSKYLRYNLSKMEDRRISGKFITIYPKSVEEFRLAIEELYELLKSYSGPRIITDKRYKHSILHYRYGSFTDNKVINLKDEIFIDRDRLKYTLPKAITEPFPENIEDRPKIIGKKYLIDKAISFSNGGGIYLGRIAESKKAVIIKEARPYVDTLFSDVIKDKKGESTFLSDIEGTDFEKYFPKLIDQFYDCEHYFIVENYISGITLGNYFAAIENKREENYHKIILEILEFTLKLHKNRYIIGDVSDSNILIDDSLSIKWVDCEHIKKYENKSHNLYKTEGFYNRYISDKDYFYQDRQQIGYLLLGMFSKCNYYLIIDNKGDVTWSFFLELAKKNNISEKFIKVIYELIYCEDKDIEDIYKGYKDGNIQIDFQKLRVSKNKYKNLNDTFKFLNKKEVYYYSNPDEIGKSEGLYGNQGILAIYKQGNIDFNDIITLDVDYSDIEIGDVIAKLLQRKDYTLETGLAKLSLWMIKEKKYLDSYVGELNKVLIDVLEGNQLNELGLLRGELGIFYSLICSAEKNYKNLLKKMLIDRINKYLFTKNYENQFPLTKRGFIYSPYIDFGSAGLLKVLIKYSTVYNDNYFYNYIYNITDELKKTNFTQNATYGKGMSGIIDALLDFYELTKDTECLNNVREKIKQLDYYIIKYDKDYYISSNTFQSAGLDYYSGSAGVISTYNRYIKLIGGEEHV